MPFVSFFRCAALLSVTPRGATLPLMSPVNQASYPPKPFSALRRASQPGFLSASSSQTLFLASQVVCANGLPFLPDEPS